MKITSDDCGKRVLLSYPSFGNTLVSGKIDEIAGDYFRLYNENTGAYNWHAIEDYEILEYLNNDKIVFPNTIPKYPKYPYPAIDIDPNIMYFSDRTVPGGPPYKVTSGITSAMPLNE